MKNCGNCANYDHAKMKFTDVCGSCIIGYVGDGRQEPSNWNPLPQTNADRIRSMSDEELAEPGRWIERKCEWFLYRCSRCGRGSDIRTNFCPHCGAKMGG